jgi:RimJ/RimL family protein N-acetyltransferase
MSIRETRRSTRPKFPVPRLATRGFKVIPLEAAHGPILCSWRYEPPYDLFNWPAWDEMEREGREFGDPELRERQFAAVTDDRDKLAGFVQFFPLFGVTRLGLGLRPDLCGQGLGPSFIDAIVKEALRRSPNHEIDLEVLVWNTRAIRVYERAGFEITDTYTRNTPAGPDLFHCMVWNLNADELS